MELERVDAKRDGEAEAGVNLVSSGITKQTKVIPVTPCAAQQTKRCVTEGNNEGRPSKMNKGNELVCARCKLSKPPDEFSKNQRKKKEKARCRECIEMAVKEDAACVKEEDVREIHCCVCNTKKQAKCFSNREREKSDEGTAKCNACFSQERAAEIEKKEIEDRKALAAEFEKAEASAYDAYRRKHDNFLEQLGKEAKEMMSTYSGIVYVITSIERGGDPFSPRLVGVYTTCENAITAARKAFAEISTTYRDGTFAPNDARIGKFDFSEFLRPCVECSCRIMGESFGEEVDADFVAIAVNAVPLDKRVHQTVPFLRERMSFGRDQQTESNDILGGANDENVYVLFECSQGDYEEDISLLGVFRSKEQASLVARDVADDWGGVDDKDEAQQQIQQAFENDERQLLVAENDWYMSMAVETVNLDKGNNSKDEIHLCSMSSGLWMNPEIELME